MGRYIGNGLTSSFWKDRWKSKKCFRLKYPSLFFISNHKLAFVAEMGEATGEGTVWNFSWRRHLFMWEEELLTSLMEDLDGVVLSGEEDV